MIWRRDEQPAAQEQAAPAREEPRAERHEREGRRRMAEDGEVTVLGQGASLEGNIVSAGSLRIDGKVKGQINADGDVTVSAQSQVDADIKAENCTIAGKFKGNIVVKGRAELARGGRVDGNITSKSLIVEEGGIFHGQSIMDGSGASASSSSGQAGASQGSPAATQTEKGTEQVKVP